MSITAEQYQQTQSQVLLFARVVRDMPLADFLNAISRAETLGPIVDPTMFREAGANLQTVKDLAEGLYAFQRAARKAGVPGLRRDAASADSPSSHPADQAGLG